MKTDLRSLTLLELTQLVEGLGEKSFRAKQLYGWVSKGVSQFDDMQNMPKAFIEKLKAHTQLENCKIIKTQTSSDGTIKTLSALEDGELIESVFMTYKHGHSACLSTQVGCKMGCTFCASAINGIVRHLSAGEYLGQIYALQELTKKKINNVVLMGSGEPLDNYDATLKFIRLATDEAGLNLSGRSITLSTCGLAPEIKKLADEKLQITLAISLHNPFDEERASIMPISRKYPIQAVMDAVKYYIQQTKRRVTFEYALINGVNDTIEHARRLGVLLSGQLVHVNLIPVNPVKEHDYQPTQMNQIKRFQAILTDQYKVNTTVRRELGSDINAACGQLRNEQNTE